jgi:PAS domain S-box-containing protein
MLSAPIPAEEQARLDALLELNILDTLEEAVFDDITVLAAQICDLPISLVSLVDKDRQWFKSHHGLEARSTPRAVSFCGHAIQETDLFIVSDSHKDPRFSDNPLVTQSPHVRFYAGAPLILSSGHCVGTLCVIDHQPRQLMDSQSQALRTLGKHVVRLLEFRVTELASREAKIKLDALLDNMADGVVVHNSTGRITEFNSRALRILGLTANQLTGKDSMDPSWKAIREDGSLFPGDQHPAVVALREGKIQQGIPMGLTNPDGSKKWISINAAPVIPSGSTIVEQVIVTFSDHTELHHRESEFSEFFKLSLDPMCIATLDGTLVRVSPTFCKLLGREASELIGRPMMASLHPIDGLRTRTELSKLSPQVRSVSFENRLTTSKGACLTVSWSVSINPETSLLYVTLRDVTKEKEMRRQLEDAQNVAKLGTWEFDIASGAISWSEQMFEFFPNLPGPAAPSYEQHLAGIHPEDRDAFDRSVKQAMQDGKPYTVHYRTGTQGNLRWMEGRGQATTDLNGRVTGLYGTCQDVTDRVRLEKETQESRMKTMQNAKMASLGEMAGGVAHEINNPLAVITGYASQIRRLLLSPPFDTEVLVQKTDFILKTTDRIARIVKGLRSFSRSAEKDPMAFTSIDQIIQDALALCAERFKHHGIEIRLKSEAGIQIPCRPTQIAQVLVNLMSNAFDAVENAPEKWIAIGAEERGNSAEIFVEDSGPGVPAELASRIMEPFFTTKDVGKGTGLGLSISKGIVEEHSGSLAYTRNEGRTRFIVTLPHPKTDPSLRSTESP